MRTQTITYPRMFKWGMCNHNVSFVFALLVAHARAMPHLSVLGFLLFWRLIGLHPSARAYSGRVEE
jgi:hypothetical protein